VQGHLIHIGYPKTGSSFLRGWFAQHPQLAYADGAIAGFATVYAIARAGAAGADADGIRYRVTSSEGLATPHPDVGGPIGHDRARTGPVPERQERVCATLAALFPTAHVLLVTRGFRTALLSGYSQYVRSGGELDFAALVRGAGSTPAGAEQLNYDRVIRLYSAAFPERLIVLPYELLRDDGEAFIRALEARLGLDHAPFRPEPVNPSLSPAELRWYPRMSGAVRRLPLRGRLRERVLDGYARLTMRGALRVPAALLQALRPASAEHAGALSDPVLERFRGRAELLRGDPLYAPYAREYLHDPEPAIRSSACPPPLRPR
jgi:hypothetical protein